MPVATSSVRLSRRAVARLRAGHPWIYRSDLIDQETPRASVVQLTDERGKFLGSALSSSSSQIALRIIDARPIEEADVPRILGERLRNAIAYRRTVYPG